MGVYRTNKNEDFYISTVPTKRPVTMGTQLNIVVIRFLRLPCNFTPIKFLPYKCFYNHYFHNLKLFVWCRITSIDLDRRNPLPLRSLSLLPRTSRRMDLSLSEDNSLCRLGSTGSPSLGPATYKTRVRRWRETRQYQEVTDWSWSSVSCPLGSLH